MQQTLTLRRVETRTLVLDVLQPLTKATLALVANGQAQGIGTPGPQAQIAHNVGAWEVLKATPSCECEGEVPAKAKGRRAR